MARAPSNGSPETCLWQVPGSRETDDGPFVFGTHHLRAERGDSLLREAFEAKDG